MHTSRVLLTISTSWFWCAVWGRDLTQKPTTLQPSLNFSSEWMTMNKVQTLTVLSDRSGTHTPLHHHPMPTLLPAHYGLATLVWTCSWDVYLNTHLIPTGKSTPLLLSRLWSRLKTSSSPGILQAQAADWHCWDTSLMDQTNSGFLAFPPGKSHSWTILNTVYKPLK